MNCQRFQSLIEEYCEGSLSPGTQAAAEEHLAGCTACRQAVQAEQVLARSLSGMLRQTAEAHTLRPEVQRRIVRELERESSCTTMRVPLAGWWRRLAWTGAVAACLLVAALLVGVFLSNRNSPPNQTVQLQAGPTHIPVSIQVSSRVPTYTFKREGNVVIDTLACETNVVNVTLWKPEVRKPL